MTSGRHVVFWSGGQDSTLVAVQLLRANEHVILVTFDNCWIGGEGQQNKEKMSRKRTLERFKTEFGQNRFEHKIYTWDGELNTGIQNKAWVSLFPLALRDQDKAYFGCIKTDEYWHVRHTFEEAFNAVCKHHEKKIELKYPLEWYDKGQVIKELKRTGYLDLSIHSGDKL